MGAIAGAIPPVAVQAIANVSKYKQQVLTASPSSLYGMDIFSRFRQHYAHYLWGVIVPAVVNGLSVPLLKQVLGADGYGTYALYFNAMLLANLLLSGWLWQAILRFAPRYTNKDAFSLISFRLSLVLPLALFLPAATIVSWQSGSVGLGLLFAATLLAAGLQLPRQALTQAGFRPWLMVQSEAVRVLSWLGGIGVVVGCNLLNLWALFGVLLVSYSFSTAYLFFKNPLPRANLQPPSLHLLWKEARPLLRYGLPFSLWYVVFYGITYLDKVAMLNRFGPVAQGHYTALFDFTCKGLILLLAPVITASTPLLAQAYENGETVAAGRLLRRLIRYEVLALLLSLIAFGWVGYRPLFWLLGIPVQPVYLHLGLLIIGGTFLWQIALLVQKRFELRLQTGWLLSGILLSIGVEAGFYAFSSLFSLEMIGAGYVAAAVVYLLWLLLVRHFQKGYKSN